VSDWRLFFSVVEEVESLPLVSYHSFVFIFTSNCKTVRAATPSSRTLWRSATTAFGLEATKNKEKLGVWGVLEGEFGVGGVFSSKEIKLLAYRHTFINSCAK
jgi:hypothetical protein